eukprot:gene7940-10596_t
MARGYRILGFRLKTPVCEIDLVAKRGDVLAVVEVKRRARLETALEAVSFDQRDRLRRAGAQLAANRPGLKGCAVRLDLMALAPGQAADTKSPLAGWRSGPRRPISTKPDPGEVHMSLKVAVQMDPIEGINIEGDTTFLMMETAQARGHSLFVYLAETLAMDEGRVFARGRDVTVQRVAGGHATLGAPRKVELTEFDVILL